MKKTTTKPVKKAAPKRLKHWQLNVFFDNDSFGRNINFNHDINARELCAIICVLEEAKNELMKDFSKDKN